MKYHHREEFAGVVILPETASLLKRFRSAIVRPWLVAAAFLCVAEVVLRLCLPRVMLADPKISACQTYNEYLKILGVKQGKSHFKFYMGLLARRDRGFVRIFFMGDSVILGNQHFTDDEPGPRDDVALSLQGELRKRFPDKKIVVYNIASFGAPEQLDYEMHVVLAEFHPDLIIKNVNFRAFNEFPASISGQPGRMMNAAARVRSLLDNAGSSLDDFLYNNVMLYAGRDYLSYFLFKGPKDRQIGKFIALFKKPIPPAGMFESDTIRLKIRAFKKMVLENYNFPLLKRDNRPLVYSRKTAAFVDGAGIPAFYFLSPINHELVDDLIKDSAVFRTNRQIISAVFNKRRFGYRDFSDALPEDDFRDPCHLTHKGNNDLARLIADQISSRIPR